MTTTTTIKKKSSPKKKSQAGKITAKVDVKKIEILPGIDPDQRSAMIAEAAYLIAEQRSFHGGATLDDWLQAETDVDTRFSIGTQLSH